MIKLTSLMGNSQKLDGGSMFGNVPKAMWKNWVEADSENRINLACRALLVELNGRKILLETGIGNFFEPKLKQRFGIQEDRHVLLEQLEQLGLTHQDIDAVILSHLHFDHAGGMLSSWKDNQQPELLFPNARIYTGRQAWKRACDPHPRDRASFIPLLNKQLENSGRLHLIRSDSDPWLGENFNFIFSEGHSPGMLLTQIQLASAPVLFAADLIPGRPWIHLPITMGYDRFPEVLIDEKSAILESLYQQQGKLFLTHDSKVALVTLDKDEKGRFIGIEEQRSLKKYM